MRHVYAPFIGRVVAAGRARLDGQEDLPIPIEAAQADLERVRGLFHDLAPTVLRSGESSTRAIHDVEVCFGLVAAALEAIARSEPLAAALDRLEGASSELWRALEVLGSIQAAEPTWSPFPTVNLAVKVAMNVIDGEVAAGALGPWLARLDRVVGRLAARASRFEALHPDRPQALSDAARALVGDLVAGAGALRLGEREALIDGVRLLHHGSEALAAVLEEMDRFVRQTARWSSMPVLEDFCRAATRGADLREDCSASVESWLAFLEAQVAGLRALPLAYTVAEGIDSFATDVALASAAFAEARMAPEPEALTRMQDLFAMARGRRDEVLSALEREMDAVALSPHLEELKELSGRFLQGSVSETLLRERVIAWLKAHAMLEMQLRDRAREALGTDAAELLDLLHQQGAGIEEATRFFRDRDPGHLVEGFRMMEAPLAGLAEIRERVLRSLRPSGGAPSTVACFSCGAPNPPGRTHCLTCGQRLPEIARAVAPEAVEDESLGAPLPRNIERVERVVRAYEQDRATAADIQYECGLFLGRLGHIRRDFERRFVPRLRAERSVALFNMARDFYENLSALQNGLHDMLAFGDHGRPDGLYRGLQECVEAGRAMRASQERIEEALEGL